MKKRLLSTIIAVGLICVTLSGCNADHIENALKSLDSLSAEMNMVSETADDLEAESEDAESKTEYKLESSIPEDVIKKLEPIAKLNNVRADELNVKVNDEGYVTFLGHKYSDTKINDEDDVLLSLEEISDIIGLDGISLEFYRSDVSTISGNTYYTFYQVAETEIEGKIIPVAYFNNLIKVAVTEDGELSAISTYLNHNDSVEISADDIVSEDEAVEYVRSLVNNPDDIIEDATSLVYWDDANTAGTVSMGKVILAYIVYVRSGDVILSEEDTDEDDRDDAGEKVEVDLTDTNIDDTDIIGTEYTAVVVSALKDYIDADKENYSLVCVTDFQCNDINQFDDGEYTSLYFFSGKEDAGEYSYTLSADWIKDVYDEYSGPDTMEVTVPVVYDKAKDLYYLADYNRKIVMGNFCELNYSGTDVDSQNYVVSKNPDDINSWNFENMSNERFGIEEYFFDPDYVLGVYHNMVKVYDMYNTQYGFAGVDTTGLPILSLVYYFEGEYPEKITDFVVNAACCGQFDDWEIIISSPALAACISPTVMGHEFTHGVNQQLTSSQYFNQPGAMMEAYADIIGEQLAILYGQDPIHEPWMIGGDYCEVMRDMGHPNLKFCPRYLNGADYNPDAAEEFGDLLDNGGVHTNSGVPNYLAYKLTHEEEAGLNAGEKILEIEENLDMWFETLYLATFITDFNDIAHFLIYSGDVTGLSDEKKALVSRMVKEHGILGDCEEFDKLLEDEQKTSIEYSFIPENADFFDRYSLAVINVAVYENGNRDKLAGAFVPKDGKVTLIQSSDFMNAPMVSVIDNISGQYVTRLVPLVTKKNAITDDQIICHIKEINLSPQDDKFVVPDGEKITQLSNETDESAKYLLIDGENSFTKYGKYIVITEKEDAEKSGEYYFYLITVEE